MTVKKHKIMRVITDGRVFPWHLQKTLIEQSDIFDFVVVGENVKSFAVENNSIRFINLSITPKINILKDFIGLVGLIHLILKEKPLIIHSIMPKAGLLTALASFFFVPIRIHTFTGQVWQTKSGFKRLFLKILDLIIVRLNTICLTDSPSQSNFLYNENIADKSNKPLKTILSGSLGGVDLQKINIEKKIHWKKSIREKYNIPSDNIVIGFLARKTRDKGALLFLEACSIIGQANNKVSFLFIGPDDSNGEIENQLNLNPICFNNLIQVGQVNEHEKYLAALDILCLPSFREGFGSIVIDAAALEIPTIGSNIPGLVDAIVNMETGILFDLGSLNNLIYSINLLISNQELLNTMGKNARSRVLGRFDSKIISNSLTELYLDHIK